jgi:hypothetical protein
LTDPADEADRRVAGSGHTMTIEMPATPAMSDSSAFTMKVALEMTVAITEI